MCSRGSSQFKIVLVMLISSVILSEKHPKTYHFLTPKRYDKHPYPFPIAFSPTVSA